MESVFEIIVGIRKVNKGIFEGKSEYFSKVNTEKER